MYPLNVCVYVCVHRGHDWSIYAPCCSIIQITIHTLLVHRTAQKCSFCSRFSAVRQGLFLCSFCNKHMATDFDVAREYHVTLLNSTDFVFNSKSCKLQLFTDPNCIDIQIIKLATVYIQTTPRQLQQQTDGAGWSLGNPFNYPQHAECITPARCTHSSHAEYMIMSVWVGDKCGSLGIIIIHSQRTRPVYQKQYTSMQNANRSVELNAFSHHTTQKTGCGIWF